MTLQPPASSKLPLRTINRIEFGILSPDEIRAYSIGEITTPETSSNGREPLQDSLSDPRLGSSESHVCATCNQSHQTCPGHFGHIELARPVYHVYYIQTIKKVLECICLRCAHLRVSPDDKLYKRLKSTTSLRQRFKLIWKHTKNKRACDNDTNCGVLHKQIRLNRHEIVVGKARRGGDDAAAGQRQVLSTQEVLDILRRIPDEECWLLGFNPKKARPEWMILTVLPVSPPCVRPSVQMGNGSSGIDDLTYMLTSILRHSNEIKKTENDPTSHSLEDHENLLIQFVSTYFDNETNLFSKASVNIGRQIKALKSRLSGKHGRIRGHLMGKRVNFTARTVITGDPNLSIDEVGVPYEIAMNLTFPERVTSFNIDRLQSAIDNGPKKYPGAAYWERELENGTVRRRDLLFGKDPIKLQFGDVVKRHLINGDLVLFNRQPTLHRPSIMCHKVRVMKGKTFRMCLAVTAPYNADCM
jgi:DNA-directed RNA polymerase II subunit RPB1